MAHMTVCISSRFLQDFNFPHFGRTRRSITQTPSHLANIPKTLLSVVAHPALSPQPVLLSPPASVSPQGPGLFLIKAYLTHGATSSGKMGIQANGTIGYTRMPYLQTQGNQDGAKMFVDELLESVTSYGWELTQGTTNTSSILAAQTQGDHYVGTANIGTSPETSVVDTDVKVWGTDNLYIVDSSIHPDLPTGNTQAITMVVAEAAVEKIIAADSAPQLKRRHH